MGQDGERPPPGPAPLPGERGAPGGLLLPVGDFPVGGQKRELVKSRLIRGLCVFHHSPLASISYLSYGVPHGSKLSAYTVRFGDKAGSFTHAHVKGDYPNVSTPPGNLTRDLPVVSRARYHYATRNECVCVCVCV